MEMLEKLLLPEQVAAILQVHPSTVYQWAHKGVLECVKIRKAVRFRKEAIDRFIGEHVVKDKTNAA